MVRVMGCFSHLLMLGVSEVFSCLECLQKSVTKLVMLYEDLENLHNQLLWFRDLACLKQQGLGNDGVNQAILNGLLRRHEKVAVSVLGDGVH